MSTLNTQEHTTRLNQSVEFFESFTNTCWLSSICFDKGSTVPSTCRVFKIFFNVRWFAYCTVHVSYSQTFWFSFIADSRLQSILETCSLATIGAGAAVDVNFIKRARYCMKESLVLLLGYKRKHLLMICATTCLFSWICKWKSSFVFDPWERQISSFTSVSGIYWNGSLHWIIPICTMAHSSYFWLHIFTNNMSGCLWGNDEGVFHVCQI